MCKHYHKSDIDIHGIMYNWIYSYPIKFEFSSMNTIHMKFILTFIINNYALKVAYRILNEFECNFIFKMEVVIIFFKCNVIKQKWFQLLGEPFSIQLQDFNWVEVYFLHDVSQEEENGLFFLMFIEICVRA